MALFAVEPRQLVPVPETTLVSEGIRERADLQRLLREHVNALGDDLLIVAEEFGDWEDSKRRIDLLAVDADANLVVIELKRTEDGGHMDLQAIRYAAMVSSLRFDDLVDVYAKHLEKHGEVGSARERLATFLGYESSSETVELSDSPRIMLVAQDFSREITTTVLWLAERGIEIRCIQVIPYRIADRLLLDFRQVLPLAQAHDYQVRLREKREVVRREQQTGARRELTLSILQRHGRIELGTEIELIPRALPKGKVPDENLFRARIGEMVGNRHSVVWLHDGNTYSPTALTMKLFEEFGANKLRKNILFHWRIRGHAESMWDEAEQLAEI